MLNSLFNPLRLNKFINIKLKALINLQVPNGSFPSISSSNEDMSAAETRYTTFTTSLVLISLQHVEKNGELYSIVNPALDFLIQELNSDLSLNYWQKSSEQYSKTPPDLDATFCAFAAIQHYRPEFFTGDVLTKIVNLLIQTETNEGGPYNTWIINHIQNPEWSDIDTVVNNNILYFLSLLDIQMPKIEALIQKSILNNSYKSLYYTDLIVCLYFLSRTANNADKENIKEQIFKLFDNKIYWGNTMKNTIAIAAVLNCSPTDEEVSRVILVLNPLDTENIRAYPLYVQNTKNNSTTYSGSEAITLACMIEALSLYEKYTKNKEDDVKLQKENRQEQKVINKFLEGFKNLPEMKKHAETICQNIIKKDPQKQITLLPFYFYNSLKTNIIIQKETLLQLGAINLSGWIAYRIFDDVLDNDAMPEYIPIAAKCLRDVVAYYNKNLPVEFQHIFDEIMDNTDEANAWERNNTFNTETIPDYGDLKVLADKSLAHCLGPVTILSLSGYDHGDMCVKHTISFFKNYIIARQLNDDAHDWQEDFEKGFINSATSIILKKNNIKDIEEMQSVFWNESILEISDLIFTHIKNAREDLDKISIIVDKTYLQSLLIPLERATNKALTERTRMLEFLKTYKG